ncbi:MAG: response regulator [Armatimonadetes bacterium]|nr:response regulator [Armatimonadota bacterium]
MIHALLIDDEATARADLRTALAAHPDVAIVGEAATLRSARTLLARPDYDLVLLDVQLIGGNAFELVPDVRPGARIVFITAHDDYAIRAFEINALDYLLKPVMPARLAEALRRAGIAEILELYARGRQAFPSLARRAQELLAEWRQQAMAAQMAGKLPPAAPEEDAKRVPTVLHNAMVAPLTPFGLAGVLWYQGESNASQPQYYRALLTALIRDWREQWGQPELPFLFVQLPGYDAPGVLPDSWALVREAQLAVSLTEPAVAMVVTADLGEADNLHPRRKEPIAERLALAARALVHGEEIESSGPVYQTMSSDGRRLRIKFDHVTGGLQAAGGTVQGFTIAGADGQFLPALATIEGDGVWLWNLKIEHPVAARYGWGNVPNGNLYNGVGLPASPFRTDDLRGEQGPAR